MKTLFLVSVSCGEGLSNGICKPVQDCPAATRSILLTKQHNLERCGFEGLIEIVCCPENDEVGTPKPVVRAPETSVSKPRKSETGNLFFLLTLILRNNLFLKIIKFLLQTISKHNYILICQVIILLKKCHLRIIILIYGY